jgi:hypothetical protein
MISDSNPKYDEEDSCCLNPSCRARDERIFLHITRLEEEFRQYKKEMQASLLDLRYDLEYAFS